jgi:tetratricopeptide (TPR) repeat protein
MRRVLGKICSGKSRCSFVLFYEVHNPNQCIFCRHRTKEREEKLNKSREEKKRRDNQPKIYSNENIPSVSPVMATTATYESVVNPTTPAPSPVNVPIAAPKSNPIANATSIGVPLAPRPSPPPTTAASETSASESQNVDKALTRMVEDRIYGYTRSYDGMSIQYATSLLDSSRAVQFREGVRLGKALSINVDRLVHFAKKDMSHGRLEEAQEFYLQAVKMDPTDGRAYLGLSRIAQRRGDLEYAKALLKEGIGRSSGGFVTVRGSPEKKEDSRTKKSGEKGGDSDVGPKLGTIPDVGPNPFLLQSLGTLEQKLGNLAAAEEFYLQAIRSRPSHAAAWVALAQLRTKELRQGAKAGRACYQSAERELQRIGAKPNAFVYTAWASMEYKKGKVDDMKSITRARELYKKALEADPRCSAAYLQLGVMESDCGNFDTAKECFEKVLTFDQRNSRVLQAYAIMESRRPRDEVNSRRVLDLFERALRVNPRDAGVYQAYALYVVELGDVEAARDLLKRGTEVDKRHAPVWQAWGVLETRYNTAKVARDVFQQGIWACAQPGGGQSGGRRCARLWQAWGVLEAQEGDHAAARRCFSRALDADQRNVAAVTAWALMEADLGNFADARSIFERTLKYFPSPSDDKTAVWRAYEVMEERAGNYRQAQQVFQRSMRENMASKDEEIIPESTSDVDIVDASFKEKSREVEVSRWQTGSSDLGAEVWMNNGSIEGKIPAKMMKKLRNGDSLKGR